MENGPAVTLRQNSAPGGCVPGPVAANSPLKNVSGNAIVPVSSDIFILAIHLVVCDVMMLLILLFDNK